MMKGWKTKFRKINGKRRKVKVRRRSDGSEQVRRIGHVNRHD